MSSHMSMIFQFYIVVKLGVLKMTRILNLQRLALEDNNSLFGSSSTSSTSSCCNNRSMEDSTE